MMIIFFIGILYFLCDLDFFEHDYLIEININWLAMINYI